MMHGVGVGRLSFALELLISEEEMHLLQLVAIFPGHVGETTCSSRKLVQPR